MNKKDKNSRYREIANRILSKKFEGTEVTKFSEFSREEVRIILGYIVEDSDDLKIKSRINEIASVVENEILGYDSRLLLASILVILETI